MITVEKINQKISEYKIEKQAYGETIRSTDQYFNYLKTIKLYMELKPNEEFLKAQLRGLLNKLDIINDRYNEWLQTNRAKLSKLTATEQRSYYSQTFNVPLIKKQIETLKFIIEIN
jgi:hypothetical protein